MVRRCKKCTFGFHTCRLCFWSQMAGAAIAAKSARAQVAHPWAADATPGILHCDTTSCQIRSITWCGKRLSPWAVMSSAQLTLHCFHLLLLHISVLRSAFPRASDCQGNWVADGSSLIPGNAGVLSWGRLRWTRGRGPGATFKCGGMLRTWMAVEKSSFAWCHMVPPKHLGLVWFPSTAIWDTTKKGPPQEHDGNGTSITPAAMKATFL